MTTARNALRALVTAVSPTISRGGTLVDWRECRACGATQPEEDTRFANEVHSRWHRDGCALVAAQQVIAAARPITPMAVLDLAKYTQHLPDCARRTEAGDCSCGLSPAFEVIADALGRNPAAGWSGLRIYEPRGSIWATVDGVPQTGACSGCSSREPAAVDIEASIGSQRMPLVGFALCADCAAAAAIELINKSGQHQAFALAIRKAVRALPPERLGLLLGTEVNGEVRAWRWAGQVGGYTTQAEIRFGQSTGINTCDLSVELYTDGEFPSDEPVGAHIGNVLACARFALDIFELQADHSLLDPTEEHQRARLEELRSRIDALLARSPKGH